MTKTDRYKSLGLDSFNHINNFHLLIDGEFINYELNKKLGREDILTEIIICGSEFRRDMNEIELHNKSVL